MGQKGHQEVLHPVSGALTAGSCRDKGFETTAPRRGGAECCAANGDREKGGISEREVRNEDGTGFEGTPLGRGAGAVGGGSG